MQVRVERTSDPRIDGEATTFVFGGVAGSIVHVGAARRRRVDVDRCEHRAAWQ